MRDSEGKFTHGERPEERAPIGSVVIRTRHKRGNERRAWIKVAHPNSWKLRAHVVWETANGPIPRDHVIHHKDGDKLNDVIENLEALTKAGHLAEHVDAYRSTAVSKLVAARRERRWSTKSATKRTGRPPTYSPESLDAAMAAVRAGSMTVYAASKAHGVCASTLHRKLKK